MSVDVYAYDDWGFAVWGGGIPEPLPLHGPVAGHILGVVPAPTDLSCSVAAPAMLAGVVRNTFALPAVSFTR